MRDNQVYWLENGQPIGPGQITSLKPPGTTLATIAAGIATLWAVVLKIGGNEVGRLITINTDGSISAIDPTNGTVTAVAAASTVTTACRVTMWQDTPVLFGDPTKGYFSWDGTYFNKYPIALTGTTSNGSPIVTAIAPTTNGLVAGMAITGTGIPVGTTILSVDSATQIHLSANATASNAGTALTVGANAPTTVYDLATFEGRVWLVSAKRGITFTAPASYTDFATADAAGTVAISDSAFQGAIERLLSALELLWELGPSAVNAIANVQASGSPLTTTFSNTNIIANVGTILPSSVSAFLRTILFLAPYGVYAIVGSTPQKLSDDLDGLFPSLVIGADTPSAVFALNNVFIWAVLVTYADPTLGNRPVLLCFARNAWFLASQGSGLTWIAGLVNPATGSPDLWGTDGSTVFKCFAGTGTLAGLMRTKLFDFGAFTTRKQVTRIAAEFSAVAAGITIAAENERNQQGSPITVPQSAITWLGSNGQPITWLGSNNSPITWIGGGWSLAAGPQDLSGQSLGLRVAWTSTPFTLAALAMEVEPAGEWTLPQ